MSEAPAHSTDPITDVPPLFESRWTAVPEHAELLPPDSLPRGFRAGGTAAGIKPSGRLDFGIVISDAEQTTSAARFTISSAPAPPVQVCRTRVELGAIRAVLVNSGNANAATGSMGRDNAYYMQGIGAMVAAAPEARIAVASTGVIGVQLDTRKLSKGASQLSRVLSSESSLTFANSIMTTDLWPKTAALRMKLSGGEVTLAAQAKGAGMIGPLHAAPPHATLLCFVETDAGLSAETADELLGGAVSRSFDRVTVDGQLSTNDSVFLLASGESGVRVEAGSDDARLMGEALDALLLGLAISLVRDGEGADRIGRVKVTGGDQAVCERVARAVAESPLVKTALNGGDPNWGRIIQAAGMALATGKPEPIDITIEGVEVASFGIANRFDQAALTEAVSGPEVEYEIALEGEGAEAVVYFSDLGHDYVTLNAEYTT